MLEKIQKLKGLNKEVVDLIKEEKMDDAVEKIAQIQELTKEMEENASEKPAETPAPTPTPEEVEKTEKINKAMEMIEKFTQLNISADTVKDLLDQFAELKNQLGTSNDTINKLEARLETVENAKGISKQADEKKEDEKTVW